MAARQASRAGDADVPVSPSTTSLADASTGRPHRIHDGVIVTLKSNLRWCSDTFEVWGWNGERGFSLTAATAR